MALLAHPASAAAARLLPRALRIACSRRYAFGATAAFALPRVCYTFLWAGGMLRTAYGRENSCLRIMRQTGRLKARAGDGACAAMAAGAQTAFALARIPPCTFSTPSGDGMALSGGAGAPSAGAAGEGGQTGII
jgi:hypothetical protein